MPGAWRPEAGAAHGSRVSGLGHYLPRDQVSNEKLAALTEVSAEWIEERTGIRCRGRAGPDETITAMAAVAGSRALAAAGVGPDDVDLVILVTSTRRRPIPGGAPEVATRMGIPSPGAFDVNAVCGGFPYALSVASDAVRVGSARHVLVVGSERLTDWLDPASPQTFVLFGDGAGAAVVSRAGTGAIGPVVWGSDGVRRDAIHIPEDGAYMEMNGPVVYRWAANAMVPVVERVCELAGARLADLDWLVLHQANLRIINLIAGALGLPDEKVVRDVVDVGNTSAASIPIALSRLRGGRASPDDLALVLGFGAGLTYAGQVVRLP